MYSDHTANFKTLPLARISHTLRMNTLFPIDPVVPGFDYTPGFLTREEEMHYVEEIKKIELHPMQFQGYTAKRETASFGLDWSFEKRVLSKGKPIPAAFEPLIEKVAAHVTLPANTFAELLLTAYPPGSVINWHRDAPPFDLIAGISFLSDCTFRLRPHEKNRPIISFPVERRSLYTIQGAARSEWQHSISPVKTVRYSITLRTLS